MGFWNHRVVRHIPEPEKYPDDVRYEICEVFYDIDGRPEFFGGAELWEESFDDVELLVRWFNKAIKQPILRYPEDFTGTELKERLEKSQRSNS